MFGVVEREDKGFEVRDVSLGLSPGTVTHCYFSPCWESIVSKWLYAQ